MAAAFPAAIEGLKAANKADALAKADPTQALPAALAFYQAKALVGAALAESSNSAAIQQALQAKLSLVNDRLAALTEQVGPERLRAALQHGGDSDTAPAEDAAVEEAPKPAAVAPVPPPASAPPPPLPTPQPPAVSVAGPAKDYFKETFELLKLAMAAEAKAKRGDASQTLEAAVQYTRTLELLDVALAPGNCTPNIQENLRAKREDVVSKRATLVEVVGAEQLEAALQQRHATATEEPAATATRQTHVNPMVHSSVPTSASMPAPAPEPEPEPEPEPTRRPAGDVSAMPVTPATLLGSPFAWRAPPAAGPSEHGGGMITPAWTMYGGLSPIPSAENKRQTAADALAQMERTLAESSRALASVKEYSAKTMAEVGDRSRKPSASTTLSPSPSILSTPISAGSSGAAYAPIYAGSTQTDDVDGDIGVRLQALHIERARRERAEAQLRDEAERRAEAEHAAKVAAEDLQRLEAALAAAERKVAACNADLERRESQLAEQARHLEKVQTESSQAVQAAEERAREMSRDRLERASEKARAYADEAVQRSSARVESERKLKEEALRRTQEEADRREAAERQAEEAADALSKMEQIYAAAEKKAQHTAEVLVQKETELAEANEALHRAKEEAERLVSEAQARAREEAESRGQAAAEAAMQVAEQAAERASEKVSAEIVLRDEALARSRAEVAKREAAERRNDELSDNLLRLEVMHEEAQEALLRSQSEADAAAELADSLRRQAEQERLSHDEESQGVAEARRAAEVRAEETAMALAKAQQMLNAQAEALARVRADADRLVTDATAKAAEKVASVVNLKKSAAREADTRLRREVAARTRLERQHSETEEALAKTEAMLAASTEALEQARKEAAAYRFQEMPANVRGVHSAGGFGVGVGYEMPAPAAGMEVPEGTPVGLFLRRDGGGVGLDESAQPKALQRLSERRARRNTQGGTLSAGTGAKQGRRERSRAAARTESARGVPTQLQPPPQHEQDFRDHLRSRGLDRYFAKLSTFVSFAGPGWLEELDELTKEDATAIGLSSEELKSLRSRRALEL
jgi:hypothetical protein